MPARSTFWRLINSGIAGPIREATGTDETISVTGVGPEQAIQINLGDGMWRDFTTLAAPIGSEYREGTLLNPSLGVSLGPFRQEGPRPFVNQFKMAEPWRASLTAGGYSENPAMVTAGNISQSQQVISIPSGADNVFTRLLDHLHPNMGGGTRWRLMWEGTGNVYIQGGSGVDNSVPNQIDFDFTPNAENYVNLIISSITTGPLRNWRLINHDDLTQYANGDVFRTAYLEEIRNWRCLRFDNWVDIVENKTTTWESRVLPTDELFGFRYAPLEYCVDICNKIGADMWYCVPYMAQNDYIENAAILVRNRLRTVLHCYIEYAHKTWDFATPQAHWCQDQGDIMFGVTGDPATDNNNFLEYYGGRSSDVARIWSAAWGNSSRLIPVVQTQQDWVGLEQMILEAPRWVALDPANRRAPKYEFKAYGVHFQIDGNMGYGQRYAMIEEWRTTLTQEEVFNRIRDQSLTGAWAATDQRTVEASITRLGSHRDVALANGYQLVCVDGGSHLHAGEEALDNPDHLKLLQDYQYSPQFGEVAQAMLEGWTQVGGGLFIWSVHSRIPEDTINVGLQRWEGDHNVIWDVVYGWNQTHQGPTGRGNAFVGTIDTVSGELISPDPVDPIDPVDPEPTLLRTASVSTDHHVHSGHSLTDTYTNEGDAWPGYINLLFQSQFGTTDWVYGETHHRDTVPGSPLKTRWEDATAADGARLGISQYQSLMITEGGPPPRMSEASTDRFHDSLHYLYLFAENAYLNGNGGQGAETVLWSIWPEAEGWIGYGGNAEAEWGDLGGFRNCLPEYGRFFRFIAEYVTWKMHQNYPELPDEWRVWVCPAHAWWMRVYDDIQAGLVPGITDHRQLFRDEVGQIHPNLVGSYGLTVLAHTFLYQQDVRMLSYVPGNVSAELDAYYKQIAWEIVNQQESAGMGGTVDAEPEYTFAEYGDPLGPIEPPTDIVPSDVPNLLWATSEPVEMDGATVIDQALTTNGTAGAPLYVLISFIPDEVQPKTSGAVFQIRSSATEAMMTLTYRQDLDVVVFDNGLSGGNHATHQVPEADVTAQTAVTIEMWIDPAATPTSRIVGPYNDNTAPLTASTNPATSLRFGTPDWGGEVMAGQVFAMAIYDRIPTQEERDGLIAWAGTQYVSPEPAPLEQLAVHIDADIDTEGERDDISAMALWLSSQDDFNIVGLTASCPDSNSQEYLNCINAYEQDRDAMITNGASAALFKTATALRDLVVQGSRVDAPAKGYWDPTDSGYAAPHAASQSLIANALVHGDPDSSDPTRKLWVIIQGGYTTLAQALHEAITLGQCPDILARIRVIGQPNWNSSWAPNAWAYIFGNMWPAEGNPGMFGDLWMLSGYLQWHAFNRDNGGSDTTFWNEITEGSFFGQHLRNTLTRSGAAFTSPHFRAGDAGAWFWLYSAKMLGNFDPTNASNLCGRYRTYAGVNPWPSQTVGYGSGSGLGTVPNPQGVTWSPTHWAPELTVDSYSDAYAAVNLTEWYSIVRSKMSLYQRQVVPAQVTGLAFNTPNLSWLAPHDGFSPITDYAIYIDGAVANDGISVARTLDLTTLVPNGTYDIAVAAINAVGIGPISNTITVTIDSNSPPETAFNLTEGSGTSTTSLNGRVASLIRGGSAMWETDAPMRLDFDPTYSQRVDFAVADADSGAEDFLLGVIARIDSISGTRSFMSRLGTDSTTQRQYQFRNNAGALQFVAHTASGGATTISGGTLTTGSWALLTFRGSLSTGYLRINGTQVATGDISTLNRSSALLGVVTTVGARYNPAGSGYVDQFDGDMLAFDSRYHTSNIEAFEASLRSIATGKGITLPQP